MDFERRPLFLEVVDHEEYVDIERQHDDSGNVIGHEILEATRTAFLHLRRPDGVVVRAEIPYEQLDPILALIIPDFNGE